MALPPDIDAAIAGLTQTTPEVDVKAAIRAAHTALPVAQHEKAFDRIRRNCHMNRGTFKRLQRHATGRVDA